MDFLIRMCCLIMVIVSCFLGAENIEVENYFAASMWFAGALIWIYNVITWGDY